ncbi:hypothetical protein ACFQ2K_04195 [Streptomyces sanglieri]|uniref:Uncharacterized protein n=1 Tax=Streptomyces sanglieri TaxID=193460 RepID=A0ABW2WL26_9ACTN
MAQFLQRHHFDPDFMELFTVQYQTKHLAWNEFCYGPDDPSYRRFRDRVAAAKGRWLEHPVAVHGTVTRTGTAGTKPFAVLATGIPTGQTGRTTEVVLRSDFPALLGEELRVGMQVLAIGAGWKIFTPQKRSVDEVQLWIKEHWNLAYWTWDKDTEQAGAPMCPPPLTPDARRNSRPTRRPSRRPPSPARRPAAPAPSPRRASAPQHEHRTAEPPGQPATAGEASSDDLARLTLKAYTKPDTTSPSATADHPRAHPPHLPPFPTRHPPRRARSQHRSSPHQLLPPPRDHGQQHPLFQRHLGPRCHHCRAHPHSQRSGLRHRRVTSSRKRRRRSGSGDSLLGGDAIDSHTGQDPQVTGEQIGLSGTAKRA